jgi:ABC-type nitrate/sulfonate/bicarbonate transport system ATPase subunit
MYLTINNISKTWDISGDKPPTIKDFSLSLAKNEFVSIIGPSGCGKSTLLQIVAGIIKPTAGKVLLEGRTIKKTCPCRALVFQKPTLFPWKTVKENIGFGLMLKKKERKEAEKIINEKIKQTGLSGYADYYPHQLSEGMKQRTQIARVLAINPEIILMDEPFAALDEMLKSRLDNELMDIWEKERKTVLFVTHSLEEALLLSDRIVLMKPNPGEIHLEHALDWPRPRTIFSSEIVETRKYLLNELSKLYH